MLGLLNYVLYGLGVLAIVAVALWLLYPSITNKQVKAPSNHQDSLSIQNQPVANIKDSPTENTGNTSSAGQPPKDLTPSKDLATSKAKENLATEYLLLLSYLAENRTKEFIELSNTIADPANSSDYQSAAQNLLSNWHKINK